MKTKFKTAATVTIHNAPNMHARGRRVVAAWLRRQANLLETKADKLGKRFTARWKYAAVLLTLALGLGALDVNAQVNRMNSGIAGAEAKTNAFVWVSCTTGTNVVASSTNLMFTAATFYGYKSATNNAAPTANTGTVYIGFKDPQAVVTTANTPAVVDTIPAGSWLALQRAGTKYNLADIYFVGTTGDKVLIVYEQ